MGKRTVLNVWLAIALLVLVWVVWQEPGHAPKPAAVKLTALVPATIGKIVIGNRSGAITLVKQGAEWELVEPVTIAANPARIENLLQVAQAESVSRFAAAGLDLAKFGLSAPAVRLRLNDTELLFGAVAPVDQRRYVKVGDTVHLIADNYMYDLGAAAAAYVSRDLVPHGKNIVALELPDMKLSRGAKGEWVATPAAQGVSQDALQRRIDEWRDAQALQVAPYDRRPEQGAVVIQLDGGQAPLRYGIIARRPELILARPEIGMQFHLAAEQAERLLETTNPAPAAAAKKN